MSLDRKLLGKIIFGAAWVTVGIISWYGISNHSPAKEIKASHDQNSIVVTKVIDGDTLDITQNGLTKRVRLIGINTPETVDPRKAVECFGHEASNFSKSIAADQVVRVELDDTQDHTDKYGRLLAYIYLPDGTMLNKELIEKGYAYEYTYKIPYKYQKDFKQAQLDAKTNLRGLWDPKACNGKK